MASWSMSIVAVARSGPGRSRRRRIEVLLFGARVTEKVALEEHTSDAEIVARPAPSAP
jgi:hypothetical protein